LQLKVPYNPHQNEVVEWKNRSLKEMTSCILHANSLPRRLWDNELNCETYIQIRYPHISIKNKTPYKAWSGIKPEVTHFCIFGSREWAQIPSKNRKALDLQSTKCIFVGYPKGLKGYIIIDLSSDRLFIECVRNQKCTLDRLMPHSSHESIIQSTESFYVINLFATSNHIYLKLP
jgi:hypothetical protein